MHLSLFQGVGMKTSFNPDHRQNMALAENISGQG
jgi:hypothetical protein